jgi:hypothetical protein
MVRAIPELRLQELCLARAIVRQDPREPLPSLRIQGAAARSPARLLLGQLVEHPFLILLVFEINLGLRRVLRRDRNIQLQNFDILFGLGGTRKQRAPAATSSSEVTLQNHAGSGLRVPVFKNAQSHTEALKLVTAGVHKTNPPLVMLLIACMVPSGTKAIIIDAGIATHDILVTSGELAGCRGDIAVEDVQMPVTASVSSPPATMTAFAFKLRDGQRGLFVGARERLVVLDGQEVQVLCTTDGIGHIVAAVNGGYVGVNGTARDWTQSKSLSIVQGRQLVLVQDSGFPNEVPKRFEVLERQSDAMIKIGIEMCLLPPSSVVQTSYDLLMAAVRNYGTNSKNLGVTVP